MSAGSRTPDHVAGATAPVPGLGGLDHGASSAGVTHHRGSQDSHDGLDGQDGLDGAAANHDCGRCRRLERRYERERSARLESEALAEQFSRQAMRDLLTGLGNRALFTDQLVLALARTERSGTSVGLLFLDLDDFKVVNDTLGHSSGDLLLAEVGRRITECVRVGDVAARLGGDEFVILCEDTGDVGFLEELARRIADRIKAPFALDGHVWQTRCSIGIKVAHPGETTEAVLRDADTAMYEAKNAGKGRSEVSTPGAHSQLVERVRLTSALRKAIDADALEVWYQPLIDLHRRHVIGAEALSRWPDPDRGMVPPDQFIALAEEIGEIGEIGARVFELSAHQTRQWLSTPDFVTHVNLHPRELDDPHLPDQVSRLISAAGVSGESMCLEITEQSLVSEDRVVCRNVSRLRDLGLELAIDDFGMSYASFSYLKRLPVTTLKIDRSFVSGVGTDRQDDAIVSAIVAMAQALGLRTVAEGIETQEQASRLLELGVDNGQGWLWAPAVRACDWAATVAPFAATALWSPRAS